MKKWLLILFTSIAFFSCAKEDQPICKDGFIFWGGDPAADGRGWYFSESINSNDFMVMDNLGNDFKVDNLPVNICVVKTNTRYYCLCPSTPELYYYHITSIRTR